MREKSAYLAMRPIGILDRDVFILQHFECTIITIWYSLLSKIVMGLRVFLDYVLRKSERGADKGNLFHFCLVRAIYFMLRAALTCSVSCSCKVLAWYCLCTAE